MIINLQKELQAIYLTKNTILLKTKHEKFHFIFKQVNKML